MSKTIEPVLTQYNKPNGNGIGRIIKALKCSMDGLTSAWRFESSFRQESFLVAILFPLSFFLANSMTHWCILVVCLFILLICELFNSATETLADKVTLENDVLIKRTKDLGSAAVLISMLLLFVVWSAALLDVLLI